MSIGKLKLVILFKVFLLLSCAKGFEPPPPDPCFEGDFSDGEIIMSISHRKGQISAVGRKLLGFEAPWEFLFVTGWVGDAQREPARVGFSVLFPPEEVDMFGSTITIIPETNIPSVNFALECCGPCEFRDELKFSVTYTDPDGILRHDLEDRTLIRQP